MDAQKPRIEVAKAIEPGVFGPVMEVELNQLNPLEAFLPPVGRRTPQTPGHFYIKMYRGDGRKAPTPATDKGTTLPWQEAPTLQETDQELLRRAGEGDSRAFHTLVDRHAKELFRL